MAPRLLLGPPLGLGGARAGQSADFRGSRNFSGPTAPRRASNRSARARGSVSGGAGAAGRRPGRPGPAEGRPQGGSRNFRRGTLGCRTSLKRARRALFSPAVASRVPSSLGPPRGRQRGSRKIFLLAPWRAAHQTDREGPGNTFLASELDSCDRREPTARRTPPASRGAWGVGGPKFSVFSPPIGCFMASGA